MWLEYFYSEQVQVLLMLKNVTYENKTPFTLPITVIQL